MHMKPYKSIKTVHLSEVVNILKHAISSVDLNGIIFTLLSMPNIEVVDVTKTITYMRYQCKRINVRPK